jgi:2-polyprenyl-6-methoxyphenol hydroxylase-like FAD-dependent oxidoreductase
MDRQDTAVVISGGGPVGLGLAITLAQRGVPSIVVERYPNPQPIPRGQNLTQRTMEHFHFWGIEKELRAARTISPEYGIGGMTSYGTLLGDYHYEWLKRALVRPFYFAENERLPQYATEAVLRRRAAELEPVTILYGWSVEGIGQDTDGVRVAIAERKGSGRRYLRAQYAVGCDGSRSIVRECAGIAQTRADHDRLMVLLVFRSEKLHELLKRYPGKSFYNVLHPRLKGYWQFFGRVDLGQTFFFHAPVPPGTTAENGDFPALLREAAGAEFDVEILHVGFWDLRFAVADHYRVGRIFVAGDAAHSHPPYGGYGINTGFEDAVNLGWKLAAKHAGWGSDELLDSYDAERRPVFESTARDFIAKSINDDRDFLAAFNPIIDRAAFEREWAVRQAAAAAEVDAFEPNYEGSPITVGEGGGLPSALGSHRYEARAGHHLAPLTLSDGRNAYEALAPGFTLLALGLSGEATATWEAGAAALDMPFSIVRSDRTAESVRWEAGLILVRPDQFVAWSGESRQADPIEVLRKAIGAI